MTYTSDELLKEWMRRRGYEPLRTDVETDVTTGTDTAAVCRRELRAWLAKVYAEAPAEILPRRELAAEALEWTRGFIEGSAEALLPPGVGRVTEVAMEGWARPAVPVDAETAMAALEANPFLLPGARTPLAIAEGRRLTVMPAAAPGVRLARLEYVPAPDADGEATEVTELMWNYEFCTDDHEQI